MHLLLGCGSVIGGGDPAPAIANSAADCQEIVADFECVHGPTGGDVTEWWRDREGHGSRDWTFWPSPFSAYLVARPSIGFGPGPVDFELTAGDLSGYQPDNECDLPACPWVVSTGSARVTGELAECPVDTAETGAKPCVAGILTFAFSSLAFESGATTEAMSLEAGFGPDRPTY